jgi:hypothetical protein
MFRGTSQIRDCRIIAVTLIASEMTVVLPNAADRLPASVIRRTVGIFLGPYGYSLQHD